MHHGICFGSQEGALVQIWLQGKQSSNAFGSQENTSGCVLPPKEDTLACILSPTIEPRASSVQTTAVVVTVEMVIIIGKKPPVSYHQLCL